MSAGTPKQGAKPARGSREFVTPEGVALALQVPELGARLAALLLDLAIQGALIFLVFLGMIMAGVAGGGFAQALVLLLFFLLRNFYFIFFELRWSGRTPGKRSLGLRVVDAGGGVLTAEAVFVRNLTRELETFLPVIALCLPHELTGLRTTWIAALGVVWVILVGLLPFFNRDRRRLGDLLAGTLVVRLPRELLSVDLGAAPAARAAPEDGLHFTPEQLGIYGIHELSVLEEILRKRQWDASALRAVAKKIQVKIGWESQQPVAPQRFLREFYRAQRAHLERDLLLGKARARKRGTREGDGRAW